MSFVLHVCFYVLLEHDGTWDTSDPCQNVCAFKLCEASRFPDCMAQKQGLQRTARDCKGLQVCKTFFFCQDLVLTCVCDFLASQVSRWKKLRFK